MMRPHEIRKHAVAISSFHWRHAQNKRTQTAVAAICLPWVPLALLTTTLVSIITEPSWWTLGWKWVGFGGFGGFTCDPNGSIQKDWNWWLPSYWIAITFAWGRFTFAAAKAIDITWDLVVGRGWQALCGWVVYSVFRRCWAAHWKADRHGIPVHAGMALQYETASLSAFWTYNRILWDRGPASSRRIKRDTVVLLTAVLYVLLCPTWLSAMTGYTVLSKPVLRTGKTSIDFSTMQACEYVVHDGLRIGIIEDACIPMYDEIGRFSEYSAGVSGYFSTYSPNYREPTMPNAGDSNFTMVGKTYRLAAPVLNITNATFDYWGYEGHAYSTADIYRLGVCQPENYYKWGFSFMLTFLFLVTTLALGLALYIVWLCTFRGSEVADSVFGSLKTAVMVSAAIGESVTGDSTQMSNAKLESERKRQGIAVPLLDKKEHLLGEEMEKSRQPPAGVVFDGT